MQTNHPQSGRLSFRARNCPPFSSHLEQILIQPGFVTAARLGFVAVAIDFGVVVEIPIVFQKVVFHLET